MDLFRFLCMCRLLGPIRNLYIQFTEKMLMYSVLMFAAVESSSEFSQSSLFWNVVITVSHDVYDTIHQLKLRFTNVCSDFWVTIYTEIHTKEYFTNAYIQTSKHTQLIKFTFTHLIISSSNTLSVCTRLTRHIASLSLSAWHQNWARIFFKNHYFMLT